jgi:riboflavin synthase alpha subunit
MAKKPWLTSNGFIDAIKRKIAVPISQNTFSTDDILAFVNEELQVAMVPEVLNYHEEYFVVTKEVPLVANQTNYPIPERAIGMKLRDVFFKDPTTATSSGNLREMTRINQEDRALYQQSNDTVYGKFFVQNNDIVLPVAPTSAIAAQGSLFFVYFQRTNQLVPDEQAAISTSFYKEITVDNTTLVVGDSITVNGVVFDVVASSPTGNQFVIGIDSATTASNLSSVMSTAGFNVTLNSAVISVRYSTLSMNFDTTNSTALSFSSNLSIEFSSVPDTITNGSVVDFLETKGGHKIKGTSITIGNNAVSGNVISFDVDDVPEDFVVGDYVCLENECIIPQIPSDLHSILAEKASARILASMGDANGLATANQKIAEMRQQQGVFLDNRVEGAPLKVVNRNALVRYGKSNGRWYR